jgi:hypothetical protein
VNIGEIQLVSIGKARDLLPLARCRLRSADVQPLTHHSSLCASRRDSGDLPRFGTRTGVLANATRHAQIKILLIARTTLDHMHPVLMPLDILVSGRSSREIL